MANQWLRLWHDMPTDPKWRTISRIANQPISLVQAIYLHLLVDASRNVTRGHVTVTVEDIASALDVTDEQVNAVLSAMQDRVMNGDRLSGWESRQPLREDAGDSQTGSRSAAQRKRDQRAREREGSSNPPCHEMSRNVTTDKDTDKEEIQKQNKPKSKELSEKPEQFLLPDWINKESWNGFVAMRKAIKKPLTLHAKGLMIIALRRMASDGEDVNAVLNQSVMNSWQGVFPLKNQQRQSFADRKAKEKVDSEAALDAWARGEPADSKSTFIEGEFGRA